MNTGRISGKRRIEENEKYDELIIEEGAELLAPEGKFISLIVNGVSREWKAGCYRGNIELALGSLYQLAPHGLFMALQRWEPLKSALLIRDNQVESRLDAALTEGKADGDKAEGLSIESEEGDFGGIIVTGNSDYTIRDLHISFAGRGSNDYSGVGAGVSVLENAHVKIEDSDISLEGVTRCAIHVGGDSVVQVNNCRLENISPDDPEWMDDFSWGFSALGSNRLVQLCDNGTVYYNNCFLKSNGWGLFSIDGCDEAVSVYAKDCLLDLTGPRSHGYAGFCIGDRNVVSFDHCKMHVSGYAAMIRGMSSCARTDIINGCDITSDDNAILCFGDIQTPVTIADSKVRTKKSTIVVKGSSTNFFLKNAELIPGNGVILQLMDNDECGMNAKRTVLPVGKKDQYIEGRDLSAYDPELDVEVNLEDMVVKGDFYNSTTELHLEKDQIGYGDGEKNKYFGGMFHVNDSGEETLLDIAPEGIEVRDEWNYDQKERGAKNLLIRMKASRVEGVISSAEASYRDGLEIIDESNRLELGNIKQTAAPTVNNGLMLHMDGDSSWYVRGKSYLTELLLEEHALILPYGGKRVKMTVDGEERKILPGHYQGKIVLSLE